MTFGHNVTLLGWLGLDLFSEVIISPTENRINDTIMIGNILNLSRVE